MKHISKILCALNLLSVVILWIPELIANEGNMFEEMFQILFSLFIVYALQGLLLFVRNLQYWDLVSASAVVIFSWGFVLLAEEPGGLVLSAPMILYFILQFIRNKISDNLKIIYLNIWNILIVFMYLLDRYTSLL